MRNELLARISTKVKLACKQVNFTWRHSRSTRFKNQFLIRVDGFLPKLVQDILNTFLGMFFLLLLMWWNQKQGDRAVFIQFVYAVIRSQTLETIALPQSGKFVFKTDKIYQLTFMINILDRIKTNFLTSIILESWE